MKKIWVMVWKTESGDEGVDGYWTEKPTKGYLHSYIAHFFADDHDAGTFYHHLQELGPASL